MADRIPMNPEARNPLDWRNVKDTDLTTKTKDRLVQTVGWLKHLEWMRQCEGDYREAMKILSARVQVETELERREPTPVFQGAAE